VAKQLSILLGFPPEPKSSISSVFGNVKTGVNENIGTAERKYISFRIGIIEK